MIRRQLVITVGTWAALLLLVISSNPAHVPVVALILPFILIFWAIYSTWQLMRLVYGQYVGKSAVPTGNSRVALAASGFAVVLLVLQSLGQLSLRDVLTMALLFAVGYFYTARARS